MTRTRTEKRTAWVGLLVVSALLLSAGAGCAEFELEGLEEDDEADVGVASLPSMTSPCGWSSSQYIHLGVLMSSYPPGEEWVVASAYQFELGVTTYAVANVDSYLVGAEHQGMGVVKEYRQDEYCVVDTGISRMIVMKLKPAPDRYPVLAWYNHGRTISFDAFQPAPTCFGCYDVLSSTRFVDRLDFNAPRGQIRIPLDPAPMTKFVSCVKAIPDGPCDALCGNCQYKLPAPLTLTDSTGHNSNNDAEMVTALFARCIPGASYQSNGVLCSTHCGMSSGAPVGNIAKKNAFASYGFSPETCEDGAKRLCAPCLMGGESCASGSAVW